MQDLDEWRSRHPDKYASTEDIFSHIHRGDTIFIGSACAEPQYLVKALIRFVQNKPKAFFGAEVLHIRSLGVFPFADEKFQRNFRHNAFFVGDNTRDAVNKGLADYTPVFLSRVPGLIRRDLVRIDIALIQTSDIDEHGYMSLGISVDIVKAATEKASVIVAQVNSEMPRVHGDTFIHIRDVDFVVPYDEPLLEYEPPGESAVTRKIGSYIARLVKDGDTIQVGYGSIPNAAIASLQDKKHLGVHTEYLNSGIIDLMRTGAVDNTKKAIDRGKTVATFCMGRKGDYDYIRNNPAIEFRAVDYTNNPLVIAQHENMVAVNSALEIDLTGQASAESLGKRFYSGVGGHADFMRGVALARHGRTILAVQSTAGGGMISRIVPFLREGAGASLNRGDVQYVVTEYGIAYISGKSIRERAMELINIAHPKFRPWLIEEAKKGGLIYQDQAYHEGEKGEYPEHLEQYRTTGKDLAVFLRPVKITDEHRLKDFLYSLSDESLYRRFVSPRKEIPHEYLQTISAIDYTEQMMILATTGEADNEQIVGVGQYVIDHKTHMADVAFAVRDDYQNKGIGAELIAYLTYIAKRQGLLGFTADVLAENRAMLNLFHKADFDIKEKITAGIYDLVMTFRN
ncbi:MAG: GNAT family N-acetyltransferase [Deltaproteobacteria bacterium]|nr:GNAT family N-acetyltransferase [Deltaproteobacteria bacterium]